MHSYLDILFRHPQINSSIYSDVVNTILIILCNVIELNNIQCFIANLRMYSIMYAYNILRFNLANNSIY